MTTNTHLFLIAAVAGIAVALQGQFMGLIDRHAGTTTSVFITYAAGGLLAAGWWFARRPPLTGISHLPWYAWSAGALGLVIVGGIGYAAPRLGLSRTMVITVAVQLLVAAAIDHFGLFEAQQRSLDAMRLTGFALAIGGVWLIVK